MTEKNNKPMSDEEFLGRPMSDEEFFDDKGATAPGGPAVSPGVRLKVVQKQHPKITDTDRMMVENFWTGDLDALRKEYASRGLEVKEQDGQTVVRDKDASEDTPWLVEDPNDFLKKGVLATLDEGVKDAREMVPMVLRGIGEFVSAEKGAQLGARYGMQLAPPQLKPAATIAGGVIGAGLGGAMSAAGIELGGQTLSKMYGMDEQYNPELIKGAAKWGAAGPIAAEAGILGGKSLRSGLLQRARKKAARKAQSGAALGVKDAKKFSAGDRFEGELSGIPASSIDDVGRKAPGRFRRVTNDPALRKKQTIDMAKLLKDLPHKERSRIGKDMAKLRTKAADQGQLADIRPYRKRIDDEIERVTREISSPDGGDAGDLVYLKHLQDFRVKIFQRTNVEGKVVGELPDFVSPNVLEKKQRAIKKYVKATKSYAQKSNDLTAMTASEDIGVIAKEIRDSYKGHLDNVHPDYKGMREAYATAAADATKVDAAFSARGQGVDYDKAVNILKNFDKHNKEGFSEIVNRYAKGKDARDIKRVVQDVENQVYFRDPGLNQISGGAVTATARANKAGQLGEAGGAVTAAIVKAPFAGYMPARKLGGALMQRRYAPERVLERAKKKLQVKAGIRAMREKVRTHGRDTLYGTAIAAPRVTGTDPRSKIIEAMRKKREEENN